MRRSCCACRRSSSPCRSGSSPPEQRLVVLFEGRDTAGKGGVIKRITAFLNPRTCRIAALPDPQRARAHPVVLPALRGTPAGCRGDRAVRPQLVQPRRGGARAWASALTLSTKSSCVSARSSSRHCKNDEIILVKYWLSVSDEEQERRFKKRFVRSAQALEVQSRPTCRRGPAGWITPRPRTECSPTPTPRRAPGMWWRAMTSARHA